MRLWLARVSLLKCAKKKCQTESIAEFLTACSLVWTFSSWCSRASSISIVIFFDHCDYCDFAIHERILVWWVSNTDRVSSISFQVIMWRYWTWWKGWPQMPYQQLPWVARTGLAWLCRDAGWFWQTILISLLTLLWTVTTLLWTYCLIFRHTYVVWHGESWWASNPKSEASKRSYGVLLVQKLGGAMRRAGSRLRVGRSQELQQEVWIGEIPKFAIQRNSGNCLSSNLPFREDTLGPHLHFSSQLGGSISRSQDVIFRYGMEAVASYLTVEGGHGGIFNEGRTVNWSDRM